VSQAYGFFPIFELFNPLKNPSSIRLYTPAVLELQGMILEHLKHLEGWRIKNNQEKTEKIGFFTLGIDSLSSESFGFRFD
jgi:hypothetical protein